MQAFLKTSSGRWLLGATLAIASVIALTLYFLADAPGANTAGQVQIAGATPAPSPLPSASAVAPQEKMAPLPIQLTPATRQKVDEQAALQQEEKRDSEWAPRSEAAIRNFTLGMPYIVGGGRSLTIACKASVCEINGLVEPDKVTGSMKPVWEALERYTAGPELRAYGLERTATIFDTGRSGDEFIIYYRRVVAPLQP